MTANRNTNFNWRAFASVLTGLSFIGMAFTGVILFIVPPGRIANWTGWTILGLTKHQWIALHDWSSIMFIIGAVLHTCFNWKVLIGYFKSKVSKSFAFRAEWILALIVCALVVWGTLAELKPFSSLLVWNESIKQGYDTATRGAHIHAELLTLSKLPDQVEGIDFETMLGNLQAAGIDVESPQAVVGELAEAANMTPVQLYNIAVGQVGPGRGQGGGGQGEAGQGTGGGGRGSGGSGGGFGRLTLRQYCEQSGMGLSKAIDTLKDAGYQAGPDMTMRAIADSAGVHPSEVRRLFEPSVH